MGQGDHRRVGAIGAADFKLKCWAVNVKSNMHLLRTASPIFNDNPQGGVFLITASIAGMAPQGSSMAYSVSKAAGT